MKTAPLEDGRLLDVESKSADSGQGLVAYLFGLVVVAVV